MVFMGWWSRKKGVQTNAPSLNQVVPKSTRADSGVRPKGSAPLNVPAGTSARLASRRKFLKWMGVGALAAPAVVGVTANVAEREQIIKARTKLLKSFGVNNPEEWARVKTPALDPLLKELGRGSKLNVNSQQVKGMNVIGDIANAVYHNGASSSKPSPDDLKTVASFLKAHWPKSAKDREEIKFHAVRLKNSLDVSERCAGEALYLFFVSPSPKGQKAKEDEINAVRQLLWSKQNK